MLGQGSLKNIKTILGKAAFVVLAVWSLILVPSVTLYLLGFSVPEILVSPEFLLSCCGYSTIYGVLLNGKMKIKRRTDLILPTLRIIIGSSVLFVGVYVMLFETPNFFAYLCIIIGTALILINAKLLRQKEY